MASNSNASYVQYVGTLGYAECVNELLMFAHCMEAAEVGSLHHSLRDQYLADLATLVTRMTKLSERQATLADEGKFFQDYLDYIGR